MATLSADMQIEERVREIVFLLMKRPITEEIALQVGEIDGFKHLEIVNGDWVGFEQDEYMTGEEHGWIETKLILALGNFIVEHNLGRLYPGDMDFVLSGNKDSLKDKYQPDIAFVKKDRLQKTSGYFYGAPDFALEIVSPTQYRPKSVEKANIYMQYGTQVVWLVFPKKKEIEVHTPDNVSVVYGIGDTISGGDLFSNFELEVAKIFET